MGIFQAFKCCLCAKTFPPNSILYTCPHDGGNLDVIFDLREDQKPERLIKSSHNSMWRYEQLLPIDQLYGTGTPLAAVGWTPLFQPKRLADAFGINNLYIKDEGRNPTASLKDRASALVVARAKQMGVLTIVTASTGNAGAALAGMAAAIGMKTVILVPHTAPEAKIAQLLVYGAQVILVQGNYDTAYDLSIKASQEFGWYCRNTGYNPFTIEGKKTTAFEIWEQGLSKHPKMKRIPAVFVSVGDGNIISSLHKGFNELHSLGWLDFIPRLFGVQAEGSSAIADAFMGSKDKIHPVHANTIADSISVDYPRDGFRALRAVKTTNGTFVKVTDNQILASIAKLGSFGFFLEPAGAAAFAGLDRAIQNGFVHPEDPIYVVNTGNGLKDVQAALKSVQRPLSIKPTIEALYKYITDKKADY